MHSSYYQESIYRQTLRPPYVSTHRDTSNKMLPRKSIALITQVKNSISLTLCPSSPSPIPAGKSVTQRRSTVLFSQECLRGKFQLNSWRCVAWYTVHTNHYAKSASVPYSLTGESEPVFYVCDTPTHHQWQDGWKPSVVLTEKKSYCRPTEGGRRASFWLTSGWKIKLGSCVSVCCLMKGWLCVRGCVMLQLIALMKHSQARFPSKWLNGTLGKNIKIIQDWSSSG